MTNKFKIIKASGEEQDFSEEKLRGSLVRSGAPEAVVDEVVIEVLKHVRSNTPTRIIFNKAFLLLRKKVRTNAARYSLKKAIMQLGPSGFPFEQLVGEILRKQGFRIEIGKILQGVCISHEVDVVAEKGNQLVLIECKFHHSAGRICNVHVPLYIRSRFNDIENHMIKQPENQGIFYQGWVVTNTRFSTDAEEYGICAGLKLIGWDYPKKNSLKDLIEQSGLFPVTALTELNSKQKQRLVDKGIILCKDLFQNPGLLTQFGLDRKKQDKLLSELNDLCSS